MDITNKTRRPLSIPLPKGKKLFLGPGKVGQVLAKAIDYPPLAKLIAAGDIEVVEKDNKRKEGGSTTFGQAKGQRRGGSSAQRQSGDR